MAAVAVVAVAAALGASGAPQRESQLPRTSAVVGTRPNILFLMVDDMRDDDLRFMPRTQRLIHDKGVRFVNSFAPHPLCCPARASVLTGLYTHNHGVYSVEEDYGFHSFDDRRTIATMLARRGYATVYLGKYLNRYGIDPPPRATAGGSLHYVPPGWTRWRASIDWTTYQYFRTTLSDDGHGFQSLAGEYQTDAYGRIASDIVRARAADARPFFVYVSFTAPHSGGPPEADDPAPTRRSDGVWTDWVTPARPPRVWGSWDSTVTTAPGASWKDPDFSDKPAYLQKLPPLAAAERRALLEVTRQRAESLTVVDRAIARIMHSLAATGELRRTLVIFTSDNGYFLGEQRMRQGKIYPHEPSLRVPLLMRGPGIPAGAIRRDPFTSIDYLPTLASVAGTVPERSTDGVSLWRVVQSGDVGWRRTILTETGPLGRHLRDTNQAGDPIATGGRRDVRFLIGVRTRRYLYVDVAHQRDELYDLVRDPREYRNLVLEEAYAGVRKRLRDELTRLRACDGATCAASLARSVTPSP